MTKAIKTKMKVVSHIRSLLTKAVTIPESKRTRFFKTEPGSYGAHDQFMGVTNPNLRKIASSLKDESMDSIEHLLYSSYNEERLLSLFLLIDKYEAAKEDKIVQQNIFDFYCLHSKQVNNWNLVDCSAHYIVGRHLFNNNLDRKLLYQYVKSDDLWQRRIAIVSTFWFIRQNDLTDTFNLALELLIDNEDLIHKATGWMLREAGKKDKSALLEFLDTNASKMPRTMLRYSLEKFPLAIQRKYLNIQKI